MSIQHWINAPKFLCDQVWASQIQEDMIQSLYQEV